MMGLNVAILVGVADAESPSFDILPCALKDVDAFAELLNATEKFHRILPLKNPSAEEFLTEMRSLATEALDLDEVTFFYSGHGVIEEREFRCVMRGYAENKRNSTGIARQQLIDIFRQLGAKMTVVVLDACHSGMNLIKSAFEPLNFKGELGAYYEFSACSSNQKAGGGLELSVFTNGFIEAVGSKTTGPIYYSNIETALIDIFENHPTQSPHVNKQAAISSLFCDDATKLTSVVNKYTVVDAHEGVKTAEVAIEQSVAGQVVVAKNPVTLLASFDESMPTEEEAQAFIDDFWAKFLAAQSKEEQSSDCFDFSLQRYTNFNGISEDGVKGIVDTILQEKRLDQLILAERIREKIKTKSRDLFGIMAAQFSLEPPEYNVTYNLENTSKLSNLYVKSYAVPRYKALSRGCADIVLIPTFKNCLLFFKMSMQPRVGWEGFSDTTRKADWEWQVLDWRSDSTLTAEKLSGKVAAALRRHLDSVVARLNTDE